jgi:hypothetical protein
MPVMNALLNLLGHDEPIPDRALSLGIIIVTEFLFQNLTLLACSNGQFDAFNILSRDERIQFTQFKLISASV